MLKEAAITKLLLLLLPFVYPSAVKASEHGWSYEITENWGINAPQCNGSHQSPIHLRSLEARNVLIPALRFSNYDIPLAGNLNLTNNGHSVEFKIPVTINGQRPFITGSTLNSRYEAQSVHFHWGSANGKGSEHVINNNRYDVEMHIVHKNVIYSTVEQASQHRDGLAVLGVMFKTVNIPDRIYPSLNRIFDQLPSIVNYQSSTSIDGNITLDQMLGDLNTKRFYTYSGSLTTPNCAEAVIWHVFPQALPIAQAQIRKLWSIKDSNGNPMINNFRPLQNRNRRPVYYRAIGF